MENELNVGYKFYQKRKDETEWKEFLKNEIDQYICQEDIDVKVKYYIEKDNEQT